MQTLYTALLSMYMLLMPVPLMLVGGTENRAKYMDYNWIGSQMEIYSYSFSHANVFIYWLDGNILTLRNMCRIAAISQRRPGGRIMLSRYRKHGDMSAEA